MTEVMRFYQFSWDQLLVLPIRIFWLLHKNMERSKAQENLRLFRIVMLPNTEEDARKDFVADQLEILGTVVEGVIDNERDEDGIHMLKRMSKGLPY